jgi:hypothetical protein
MEPPPPARPRPCSNTSEAVLIIWLLRWVQGWTRLSLWMFLFGVARPERSVGQAFKVLGHRFFVLGELRVEKGEHLLELVGAAGG